MNPDKLITDNSPQSTAEAKVVIDSQSTESRPPLFSKNRIIPALLVILAILVCTTVYLIFQNLVLKSKLAKYQKVVASPTPFATTDPMPNWKIYKNTFDNYEFRVPKEWGEVENPEDEKHLTIFKSPDGLYKLTANVEDNLNPKTGNAYENLDTFIGLPYTVKTVTVGEQSARQPLPRAGTDDTFKVYFFSNDSKLIFSLELLIGDGSGDDHRVTPEIIEIGSKVFDQLISTFKFTL